MGLLDAIDRVLGTRIGLLVNDPRAAINALESDARAFNQASLLATQAERNVNRGLPVTPEQLAAKQYIDRKNEEMAMGFAGTTIGKPLNSSFNIIKKDASDIFGAGFERIRYTDPKSGGTIEILSKPDRTASVLSLEVPQQFRGQKIGESLQAKVMQDFPKMQGQVSSKAAAKTAYRLGRRPVGQPNATLDDIFKAIDDNSSVNLISPEMQKMFK